MYVSQRYDRSAMDRAEQIDRAMQEIALCRAEGSLGAIIGELDWLTELHRLLYEEKTNE